MLKRFIVKNGILTHRPVVPNMNALLALRVHQPQCYIMQSTNALQRDKLNVMSNFNIKGAVDWLGFVMLVALRQGSCCSWGRTVELLKSN